MRKPIITPDVKDVRFIFHIDHEICKKICEQEHTQWCPECCPDDDDEEWDEEDDEKPLDSFSEGGDEPDEPELSDDE